MKATWIEGKYGFCYLHLPGGFTGVVGWDSMVSKDSPDEMHGFKVSFEETTLVKRFKSIDAAKTACEVLAKHKLEVALASLK